MSLVERALKKIQEGRGHLPAAQPPAPSAGSATPVRDDRAGPASGLPAVAPETRRTARTIHVDLEALRAQSVLPPPEHERQLSHQYRQIKRPLIENALGRGAEPIAAGRLIMIASALPGEGKTFTSINLALSFALEQDLSVLLVDADVPRPRASAILGIERERGLLDLLRDDSLDADSLIHPTDIPRLSVLAAGTPSDTATELLASVRMQHLAAQLAARDPHQIVIFDSPPLLMTTESRVLSTVVGQIVLVVRAESTPRQAVLDSLDLLGEGRWLGLVLNQCDEQGGTGYYQYYGERPAASEPPE